MSAANASLAEFHLSSSYRRSSNRCDEPGRGRRDGALRVRNKDGAKMAAGGVDRKPDEANFIRFLIVVVLGRNETKWNARRALLD